MSDALMPTVTQSPACSSIGASSSGASSTTGLSLPSAVRRIVPSLACRDSTLIRKRFSTPTRLATAVWPGCPSTSMGTPRAMVRPSSMTCTWSPIASASSRSWVTRTTGMGLRARVSRNSRLRERRRPASSAEKGSSRSSSRGCVAIALASATRCCCPPESSHGYLSSSPRSWKTSSRSSTGKVVFRARSDLNLDSGPVTRP